MGGVGVEGGTEQVTLWWLRSREENAYVSELSPLSPLLSSGPQPVGCFYSTQGVFIPSFILPGNALEDT